MKRRTSISITLAFLGLSLALGTGVRAQEHPEHPEHPSQAKTEAPAITMAALSQAIQDYVAKDSKLKGGYFLVFDSESKRVLQLKLAKVHEEKLASLGGGVYFACADFNSADTTLYDLDIFMKASGKRLETTEVAVHKVNGNPRYNWKEEGGIWKKQPVAGK